MRLAIINLIKTGMSGGYKKYLYNMIPRLDASPEVESILCAAPPFIKLESKFKELRKTQFASCKPFIPFLKTDAKLLRQLDEFCPDVIFVPVERTFAYKNIRVVNMLQNMEPFVKGIAGNTFPDILDQKLRYYLAVKALKKADGIIAPTNFVKDIIRLQCQVPEEKISLINYGYEKNKIFHLQKPAKVPENWKGEFIFTAGSIRPARGTMDLLTAVKLLRSKGSNSPNLVIAGQTDSRKTSYYAKFNKWLIENGLKHKVCWAGGLSEAEMDWCYHNCKLFVMTSRVESFGIIAAEALANGCICVSTDRPCLPEIFGKSAIYYPAGDSSALAEKISEIATWNVDKRSDYSAKAKIEVEKFSWDKCAAETIKVLS